MKHICNNSSLVTTRSCNILPDLDSQKSETCVPIIRMKYWVTVFTSLPAVLFLTERVVQLFITTEPQSAILSMIVSKHL